VAKIGSAASAVAAVLIDRRIIMGVIEENISI
jgi:hypothetical protein